MSYATLQDLINRFGEPEIRNLSDRAGAGEVDPEVVAGALADADGTIDSYLGGRYRLPLATIDPRLTRVAADLARRYLYAERSTDEVLAIEKRALEWLRDVAAGKAVLAVPSDTPTPSGMVVMVEESRPVFRDRRNRIGGW